MQRIAIAVLIAFQSAFAQDLPSFEVASVKPVALGSGGQTATERDRALAGAGGRVDLRAIDLGSLVIRAFDLQPDQLRGPSWLNSQAYQISAVIPAGTPPEKIPLMFQSLLAERFQLKYHREAAVAPAYTLVVDPKGAKLKPGIPGGDLDEPQITKAPNGLVTAKARGPFGIYTLTVVNGTMHYEFPNISMKDLAQFLNQAARRVLDLPVVDSTDVTGRYQVSLDLEQAEIHGPGVRQRADSSGNPPEATTATDPAGSSIRTSLAGQGLRLVRKTVTQPKFIIDQIERTPTEN